MALSLSSAALAAGNGETHLTIIGTSDTHGNIWGYSYEDMKESTGDGLARVSAYVNQVRSENPNTILVDEASRWGRYTCRTRDFHFPSLPPRETAEE